MKTLIKVRSLNELQVCFGRFKCMHRRNLFVIVGTFQKKNIMDSNSHFAKGTFIISN